MNVRTAKLVQSLQELREVSYVTSTAARHSHAKAERVINLLFDYGRRRPTFTPEERNILGALLVRAIGPIQANVERAGCLYRTRLDSSILKKRSALQFLVDNFGDIPVGQRTVSDELAKENIQESIDILDKIIATWRDVSDDDEPQSDTVGSGPDIQGIPSSHTWWSC